MPKQNILQIFYILDKFSTYWLVILNTSLYKQEFILKQKMLLCYLGLKQTLDKKQGYFTADVTVGIWEQHKFML